MRFNSLNAREMAARSVAARKAAETQPNCTPAPVAPVPLPAAVPADADPYVTARLLRVRRQLDRLDRLAEQETDPAKLDKLASAQARLADQERVMANRPLPGSMRPKAQEPQRRRWDDWEPQPIPILKAEAQVAEAAPPAA